MSRSGESNLLDHIAGIGDEAARWDCCHLLWRSVHGSAMAAARGAVRKFKQAFVDGRLRKRKVRGSQSYKVTIEPEA